MQSARPTGLALFVVIAIAWLSGCAGAPSPSAAPSPSVPPAAPPAPVVTIHSLTAGETIVLDGELDEPIWQRASRHTLKRIAAEVRDLPWDLDEPGSVQLAIDETHLYIAYAMADTDLVAEGTRDNEHHYTKGDVVELFIKPADQTWYWEVYLTPRGHRTLFFVPGAGRIGVPSTFSKMQAIPNEYRTGITLEGTLNNWSDRDTGWTAELAIPLSLIENRGLSFGPSTASGTASSDGEEQKWVMLLARYNFNVYREHPGGLVTTWPQLPVRNFHLPREFAPVKWSP